MNCAVQVVFQQSTYKFGRGWKRSCRAGFHKVKGEREEGRKRMYVNMSFTLKEPSNVGCALVFLFIPSFTDIIVI